MAELRFDGRVAVVTGAGRGIGRAHAHLLAARGAAVVVNDIGAARGGGGEDSTIADAVAEEIRTAGGSAAADTNDVSTRDGAERLVAGALDRFGRVDVVVNNAGVIVFRDLADDDIENFERHFAVHAGGTFNVCQAAWPHLVESRSGRIVNTTSSAFLGFPNLIAYGAAKGAVLGLSRALALLGAENGIAVNLIAPVAKTRMFRTAEERPGEVPVEASGEFPPEDVAAVVAFLAHETCPANGEILSAGGGRIARMFIAAPDGYLGEALTPEDVRDNWDVINDTAGFRILRRADEIEHLASLRKSLSESLSR